MVPRQARGIVRMASVIGIAPSKRLSPTRTRTSSVLRARRKGGLSSSPFRRSQLSRRSMQNLRRLRSPFTRISSDLRVTHLRSPRLFRLARLP